MSPRPGAASLPPGVAAPDRVMPNSLRRGGISAGRGSPFFSGDDATGVVDMDQHELRVTITDDDIRVARRLWLAASDDPLADGRRVEQLHEDLRHLIHAQAQQFAESFRLAHRAAADSLRAERRAAPGRAVAAD